MRARINDINRSLRSDHLTKRRAGARQLKDVLENGDACAAIDVMCTDRQKTPMWCLILKNFLYFAEAEIQYSLDKKRPPRGEVPHLMQLLLRRADESFHMLHLVAGSVVTHLLRTLEIRPPLAELQESYCNSCVAVLSVPEYARMLDVSALTDAMAVVTESMEWGSHKGDASHVARFARIWEALLCNYTGDVYPCLVAIVKSAAAWCIRVDNSGFTGREPITPIFSGVNAVLRRAQGDCAGVLLAEGQAVFEFGIRHLRMFTRSQREAVVEHLRLQMLAIHTEQPEILRGARARSSSTIWDTLPGLGEFVFSENVFNTITPAVTARRGVDIFRIVDAGAARQILLLAADLVFYDALGREGTRLKSQKGSRKRGRDEGFWGNMLRSLADAIDPERFRGASVQQIGATTGGAPQVHSSAYAWSLLLATTLQLRGRSLLKAGVGIDGLVSLLVSITKLLATDPKELLLALVCLTVQGILRTIRIAEGVGIGFSPQNVLDIEKSTLAILKNLMQKGSQMYAGLRDGDAGSFQDATFRLLTSLLRSRNLSGRAAPVLDASIWNCPFWHHVPYRSAVPSIVLMMAHFIADAELGEGDHAPGAQLKSAHRTRRAMLLTYLRKLPLQCVGRLDSGDETSSNRRSQNMKLPELPQIGSFYNSILTVYKISFLMLIQLVGGPPAVVWLHPDKEDDSLEFFDLVDGGFESILSSQSSGISVASRSRTRTNDESAGSDSSVDCASFAFIWSPLDDACGGWSYPDAEEEASWRLLASIAAHQGAIAHLFAEDVMLRNQDFLAFACTTFQRGARVCKEYITSLSRVASAADAGLDSCTEILALSIETISQSIGVLSSFAGDPHEDSRAVSSTVELWSEVAALWMQGMLDEDAAGASLSADKKSGPADKTDEFEDASTSPGQKPRGILEAQTSGVSLRLMTATTGLSLMCNPKSTTLCSHFLIRQDDFAAETRAMRSLLRAVSGMRHVPIDAAEPVLQLIEDGISYKQAVSEILESAYTALTGLMLSWKRHSDAGEEFLPRILSLVYPTDNEVLVCESLRKHKAARAAQVSAASAALQFFKSSKTAMRFIQLLHQYFMDCSYSVRVCASHGTQLLLSEAEQDRVWEIFEVMSRNVPPLDVDVRRSVKSLETISGHKNLPVDYVVLQKQAYETTALHTLVSMAAADSKLIGTVVHTICTMHKSSDLRASTTGAISRLACLHGYKDTKAVAGDSFESIISKWLSESRSLMDFPFDLLGFEDDSKFYHSMVDRMLPMLLLSSADSSRRFKDLESIADRLSFGASDHGISKLLHRYCVEIFAASIVVDASGKSSSASRLEELVGRMVPSLQTMYLTLQQNLQGLVHKLIDNIGWTDVVLADGSDLPGEKGSLQLCDLLAKLPGKDYVGEGFMDVEQLLKHLNTADIMLHFLQRMQETKQVDRCYSLFDSLSELVTKFSQATLFWSNASMPIGILILSRVFQWCASRDVLVMAPRLHTGAAALMRKLLKMDLPHIYSLQMVRDFFLTSSASFSKEPKNWHGAAKCMENLAQIAETLRPNGDLAHDSNLVRISHHLDELKGVCPVLTSFSFWTLRDLAPGSPVPDEWKPVDDTAELIQDISALERGDRLRVSPSVIAGVLPILEGRIHLLVHHSESKEGYPKQGSLPSTLAQDVLRTLVISLCSLLKNGPSPVPDTLVVKVLGQVGVCNVAKCLNIEKYPYTKTPVINARFPKGCKLHTILSRAHTLAKLTFLLFDDQIEKVAAARLALDRIIGHTDVDEVLGAIGERDLLLILRSYRVGSNFLACNPIFSLSNEGDDLSYRVLAADCGEVASPRERFLASTNFEAWIKEAACSLIRECAWENFWLACVPVCEQSVDLCRTVYPAVLYDVLSKECFAGSVTHRYRAFLSDVVFRTDPPSEALQEVMRTCIDALLYCLNKHVHWFKSTRSNVGEGAEDGNLPSSGSPETPSELFAYSWPYLEWVKDHLLKIASTAADLGAHCTALLFVELWCDYHWGPPGIIFAGNNVSGGVSPKARMEAQHIWEVESLLHRIYLGLGDFDSADHFEFRLQAKAASALPAQFLYGGSGFSNREKTDARMSFDIVRDGQRALHSLSVFDASLATLASQPTDPRTLEKRSLERGVAASLRDLGLWHVVDNVVSRDVTPMSPLAHELQAEAAWRTGSTRFLERAAAERTSVLLAGYHFHLYAALRGLQNDTKSSIATHLKAARKICSASVRRAMQDDLVPNLLKVITACQSICEVEESLQSMQPAGDSVSRVGAAWRQRFASLDVGDVAFEHVNFINGVRSALLKCRYRSDRSRGSSTSMERLIHGVSAARLARRSRFLHHAQAALESVRDLIPGPEQKMHVWEEYGTDTSLLYFAWHREQAHLDWSRSMYDRALRQLVVLQDVVSVGEDESECPHLRKLQRSLVRVMMGQWLAENKSESTSKVKNFYLEKGADEAREGSKFAEDGRLLGVNLSQEASISIGFDEDPYCVASAAVAEYVAGLYDTLMARAQSAEWKDRERIRHGRQFELDRCTSVLDASENREERQAYIRHIRMLESELKIDEDEASRVASALDDYLLEVMRSYRIVLSRSSGRNLHGVSRVVSLWFSSKTVAATMEVNSILKAVSSHKFVPLSYQIFSRLDDEALGTAEKRDFQVVLGELVLKMCKDHPHHCLLQLIALRNGGQTTSMKYGENQFMKNVNMRKVDRASELLLQLEEDDSVRELLRITNKIANGYLTLSEVNTSKVKGRKINLKNVTLSGRENLSNVARELRTADGASVPGVFTINPELRADADYSDSVVRISRFEETFQVADQGISAPKIIFCLGRDGQKYKQLVKGQDDTRQDAVMQQTFATVNEVLREDSAARASHLRIVTYRIVPLSPQAGVLEWVENTEPFGAFLIDKPAKKHKGAHSRYYPQDWSHADCRKKMKLAHDSDLTLTDLVDEFQKVCKHIRPAFRFFMLEKFSSFPELLITRRASYTKSVACSSIVGHVLGIGDRHTMNILVHQDTAEVVHIDFGITFEQGRNLSQPETVPFRLTRDIIDGMGVTHTSGTFTKACVDTLRVLKKSQSLFVTILEVLLHDPLFKWMLSPVEARKKQGTFEKEDVYQKLRSLLADDSLNEKAGLKTAVEGDNAPTPTSQADAARRAILKVKQKLAGYEDDEGDALSVEGQVKKLITEAQDPRNLCRVFHGWAPWL